MSIVQVNKIQDTTGDDALSFDSSGNTTVEQNLTVDGTTTLTGAVELPIDTVDIDDLSATGTASSSTFLRGDNAWQTVTTTTETAYTSFGTGTTSEITGISASAKFIKIVGADMSFGANSAHPRLRLGGASGYKTSGYKVTACEGGGSNTGAAETDGFTQMYTGAGGYTMNFIWDLIHVNANIWNLTGYTNAGNGTETTDFRLNGTVDLGETLTKLQFDADSGASFDDGDWKLYVTTL